MTLESTNKRRLHDDCYLEMAKTLCALASAKRLELLDLLSQSERTLEALANETMMSAANASRHLRILEDVRLIESRKEGRFVVYRLVEPLVVDFFSMYCIGVAAGASDEAGSSDLVDLFRPHGAQISEENDHGDARSF